MGSFFGLADTVAILVVVGAVAGVIGVIEWLGPIPVPIHRWLNASVSRSPRASSSR
jgi:hypothetical protein